MKLRGHAFAFAVMLAAYFATHDRVWVSIACGVVGNVLGWTLVWRILRWRT